MPVGKCSCWEVERVGAKGAASLMILKISSDGLELHQPPNAVQAKAAVAKILTLWNYTVTCFPTVGLSGVC